MLGSFSCTCLDIGSDALHGSGTPICIFFFVRISHRFLAHIGKSPVCLGSLAASLGIKEVELEIRHGPTYAMLGGTCAA